MWPWILTLGRLPLAAVFAVAVAMTAGRPVGAAATVGLTALAALIELTDVFDGMVARRMRTVTELGGLVDPLCDSLSRLAVFFAIALAGWVWIGVPLVMVGRDIVVAYVRIVLARTNRRTAARLSGKLKALVQGAAVFVVIFTASPWLAAGAVIPLRVVTAAAVVAATLWSLVDYLRGGLLAAREMMADGLSD
ncbi:MAG: CDP-alcohol phosphatidyltransferase family protein [Planctomycetota bacterium]